MISLSRKTTFDVRSILIASDFSAASERALNYAIEIARGFEAKLFLVHVVASLALKLAGAHASAQATTVSQRLERVMERTLVDNGTLRDIRHELMVRTGDDVWSELLQVIRQESIDLLVIGTEGRRGFRKFASGSIAEQIFRQACCPVLTVGPRSPAEVQMFTSGSPRPLLVATDFGEASIGTLPLAISLVNRTHRQLLLAHILSPEP